MLLLRDRWLLAEVLLLRLLFRVDGLHLLLLRSVAVNVDVMLWLLLHNLIAVLRLNVSYAIAPKYKTAADSEDEPVRTNAGSQQSSSKQVAIHLPYRVNQSRYEAFCQEDVNAPSAR